VGRLLVFHAGFGSVREQCATPMDRLPPAWVACARSEPRALSSLGGGKGYGRGAEGVGPSHRKEGNGELGKGFGANAITYWTAGEATEKGEGDQDAGSKQVGAEMPIVAVWEASVTPYESAKNARSVARTVLAAVPASSR